MSDKTPKILYNGLKILFCAFLLLKVSVTHAAMYKYLKADGSTILTSEKLRGPGNKLVKIYKMKKRGAYQNSTSKKTSKKKKTSYKKKKRSFFKSKKRKTKKYKRHNLKDLVKANGRDDGIIVGCNSSKHLGKQAKTYRPVIQVYSRIYDVDEELIHAIVRQESCFNEGAHSRVGAIGLMQLMPQTALGLRINDPWNPEHNIQGGIKYISQMLRQFNGNYKLAIAAYNAGPGNVNKYGGIPPFKETRNYVKKVFAEYNRLKREGIHYKKPIRLAAKS